MTAGRVSGQEKRGRLSWRVVLLRLEISCECTEPPGSRSDSTGHRVKQSRLGRNAAAEEMPDTSSVGDPP